MTWMLPQQHLVANMLEQCVNISACMVQTISMRDANCHHCEELVICLLTVFSISRVSDDVGCVNLYLHKCVSISCLWC